MCMGSSPSPAPPPPPPPPPPPVLDQSAPATSAPKQAEQLANRAAGTKKYRNSSLGIADTSAPSGGSGLGIAM